MELESRLMQRHWRDELDHWTSPVLANLLWTLGSILVITMPLALVGLLGVMYRWTNGDDSPAFSVFFGTIRRTWLKAYLLVALDLLIGGLIYVNLLIFQLMDMTDVLAFISRSVTLFVAILLVLFNLYAWTLIAVWDQPLKPILRFALTLVFAQPLWTLVMAFGIGAALSLAYVLPGAAFITVIMALVGYIASRGTAFVVSKYIPLTQFKLIDVEF
ncbi:MAG TPA: DUF624 domain-containing protein [Phototrophicaceae bacterium]|jgi:uncharacterized membrane protein YesL|nr:DUF624 domain-containing protein [Phototrophicaceae bacterium]